MSNLSRFAILALVAAIASAGIAGTASADTNKNEQNSLNHGSLINAISPAAVSPVKSDQINNQIMKKSKTSNFSLIDYFGTAIFRASV